MSIAQNRFTFAQSTNHSMCTNIMCERKMGMKNDKGVKMFLTGKWVKCVSLEELPVDSNSASG